MAILNTIVPIFLLILLGVYAKQRGFMPPELLGTINRLVFYLAIPAMIFRSISKASLKSEFHPAVLALTLFVIILVYFLIWLGCILAGLDRHKRGTFIQSGSHGNLGYIGLAVAFYYLGEGGLVKASLIAGVMMIIQNVISVIALQVNSPQSIKDHKFSHLIVKIIANPIILSALGGIVFSASNINMPMTIDRSLQLIGQMALPLALLVIGASLSFGLIYRQTILVMISAMIKLLLLPAIGWGSFRWFSIAPHEYLPALIMLASPTATSVYVMGREMQGDPDLATATISMSTLASAVTFSFWLNL
jgi:predicted permease